MAQYITGTVDTTAGDETIAGTDTEWLTNMSPGDEIIIGQDNARYVIGSVASDTSAELTAKYPSTIAGRTYVLNRDFTSALDLPLPNAGDLRFDVLNRRQMQILDAAAQLGLSWQGSIIDKDLTDSPPGAPDDGDAYIVGTPVTTGAWFGQEDNYAVWSDGLGDWVFTAPEEKDFVLVIDEEKLYLWDGSAWRAFALVIAADQAKSLIASDGDPIDVVVTDAAGNVTVNTNSIDIDFLVKAVGAANALRVQGSDGKVGVGVAIPLGNLHIQTASTGQTPNANADELVVENTGHVGISLFAGPTSNCNIFMGDSGSPTIGRIVYLNNGDALAFFTANGERVRIDSAGNVGIGDSTPTPYKLNVAGDGLYTGDLTVNGDLFGSHATSEGGDGPFSVQNSLHGLKIADIQMTQNAKAFPAPRSGSITEMSINYDVTNVPASGANLAMGVDINAATLWSEALDSAQANNKTDYATAASGTYTFSAGDKIAFGVGEDANVQVDLDNVIMVVRMQFDT